MDLRVKKTLINIREAFFSLRKKKTVEKITVKELSETAMINKATFYLHYKDIYDLSDKLQENLIDEIVNNLVFENFTRSKECFEKFTKNLINSIVKQHENISVIFTENSNDFINRLEKKLKDAIYAEMPELKNNVEKDMLFSYIIYGSYSVTRGSYNCTRSQQMEYLSEFSLKLMGL